MLLSVIYDCMENKETFYDESMQDYYVTITNGEIAKAINISISSVKHYLDKCVYEGLIIIKLLHNHKHLIFLTDKSKKITGINLKKTNKFLNS